MIGNKDGKPACAGAKEYRRTGFMRVWVKVFAAVLVLGLPMAAPVVAQDLTKEQIEAEVLAGTRGAVTRLPLPRYVSLKTSEGNARRGPGLTHRIDWVFTRAGMPLRITAEYENWRRIEDAEGAGGWVHYSLLSGTRSALVSDAVLDLRAQPMAEAAVVLHAEAGVIARVLECRAEWCRLSVEGERGWAIKTAFWGVRPDEIFD
ncbi:SH3-like domain-containing protein [Pseudorhodobacter antarcticus]|jgi:SH3-like domain-containing protein|uniref:SH3-like domain-containing protein n=2 Tax=Pseudorhodobacter antarcticus TaxID=1077947 RepID=A0A1H8B7C7_9RHOB|nr:SH3 domain-containing protein [Pseudorhodobacter antarcticus]SEM77958.1 SH3-like domain-containing protein [Pseudorhodobacter antarcticus]